MNHDDAEAFSNHLRDLHQARRARVIAGRQQSISRARLTATERSAILSKTDGRCHLCGGAIAATEDWQADHVLAHSAGGKGAVENYLAAHALCNNYRWHYDAEEFQWILKLGVWLRTQIERKTVIGRLASKGFIEHEARRSKRRKPEVDRFAYSDGDLVVEHIGTESVPPSAS